MKTMLAAFPETAFQEVTYSDAQLLAAYREIVKRGRVVRSATSRHTEYSKADFRHIFCRAAIAMNQRQLLAPAARPQITISHSAPLLSDAEKLISNDRQVIDLHWLWCRGYQPVRFAAPSYRSIFNPDKFDCERAWVFVTKVGTTERKAEKLDLDSSDELLLARLRRPSIRDEAEVIDKEVQSFRKAISGINGPAGIALERWAMVRKADLIGASDHGGEPRAAVVIKVYRWLTADRATTDAALRKTVKKVRAYAEKLGSAP